MRELFNNPQMLHAALVHMPIALAILGAPLVYLCAVLQGPRRTLTGVTIAAYALLAAGAYASAWTGERSREDVPPSISAQADAILNDHAVLAEYVWGAALITMGLMILSLVKFRWLRMTAVGIAMVTSLATAGLVTVVAHYGGKLVYEEGIGVPAAQAAAPQQPPPSQPTAEAATTSMPAPTPATPVESDEPLIPIREIVADEANAVSYVRDVKPIIADACIECHEGLDAEGDYEMTTVEVMLLAGKKAGPGIIPLQPDASSVVKYIRGEFKPRMPKEDLPLTEDELHTIRMWIAAGAKDDSV